ncbi:hypothetical protein BWQ96_10515 [Gracilariopsis chorda]|uniref:Uncharacterized protein n=1 Tax=Gracilariopsis chorda TaxID=448386 RepID=A0A2V3IC25_9FLOR|nr:hypothetical protein BWQ96_10685 [Gracilariopsis chorda]PXF39780.1 hypothetical protein BWQ96_10515 [Gracilariopsis chorda]|eukprot:PXF39621.1 hypothetical protein BWQ96_10685 [Gracilariopsis chorda]
MSALSEYVVTNLVLILQSGGQCAEDAFYEALGTKFVTVVEENVCKVVDINFASACMALSDDTMSRVLERSVVLAHTSVINAAKLARGKHGRKKFANRERISVSACALQNMLPEFMDLLATELANAIEAFPTNQLHAAPLPPSNPYANFVPCRTSSVQFLSKMPSSVRLHPESAVHKHQLFH